MVFDIKEIEKRKDEFIDSIDKHLLESGVKTEIVKKEMDELDKKVSENILELSRLLS